jgi:hypothetical protein
LACFLTVLKVYLLALKGYIPAKMIQSLRYLIEFCYIVRRDVQTTMTVIELEKMLELFHEAREVFFETGIRERGSMPPRQHSLVHYPHLIREFGSPNGLCSSITESKHIKAVKEPWRWSNQWNVLSQMLITNQWLDKLVASEAIFKSKQMLDGKVLTGMERQLEGEYYWEIFPF